MLQVSGEALYRLSATTSPKALLIDPYQVALETMSIPQSGLGSPSCLLRFEAFRNQLFRAKLDVKLELVIRIGLRGAPSQSQPEKTLHQALAAARIFPTTATYLRHSASSAKSWSRPAFVSW